MSVLLYGDDCMIFLGKSVPPLSSREHYKVPITTVAIFSNINIHFWLLGPSMPIV